MYVLIRSILLHQWRIKGAVSRGRKKRWRFCCEPCFLRYLFDDSFNTAVCNSGKHTREKRESVCPAQKGGVLCNENSKILLNVPLYVLGTRKTWWLTPLRVSCQPSVYPYHLYVYHGTRHGRALSKPAIISSYLIDPLDTLKGFCRDSAHQRHHLKPNTQPTTKPTPTICPPVGQFPSAQRPAFWQKSLLRSSTQTSNR